MKECISLLKIAQIVLIALMAQQVFPQVGIGTTAPDASSLLHADDGSGEKGILIPSVALIGTNTSAPINPAPATSLLVYNVATSGAGSTVVTPGYYYWDGVQWVRLNDDNDNIYTTDGTLTGNRELTQNTNTLQFTGNVGRNALTLKRTDNSTETGLAFRNSGNAYDASIHMESPNSTGLVIASGGNDPDVNNLTASAIFNNDATTSFSEEIRVYEGTANTNDVTSALGSQNDDGYLELYENNTVNHRIDANGTTQFNQKQLDLDLRVATSNNANTLFVDGGTDRIGIRTNAPQQNVHLAGNSGTVRIESLNSGNNAYNVPADPVPVYVDNNGDLNLQPPLIQTFMPINLVNFLPATTMISTDGSGQVMTLLNTNLNLTQESLVHITYQFSVQVVRADGTALTDGASRLFRAGVLVNGGTVHLGYDTGTYTNNPDANASNNVYASGYYYLSGSGYVQLPAGNHTLTLDVLGFGASYDFRMVFGETTQDRFQVVVHR